MGDGFYPEGEVMQSNGTVWTGRILTALVVLFLLFDCSIKLLKLPAAVAGSMQLGYSEKLVPVIGAILFVCVVFYLIPRTNVLGAILLTGYLGGAAASSIRAEKPLFNDLFPIIFAALMWLGLYLRDPRVRELIPLKSSQGVELGQPATGK
jgi:hypothetical protein